MPTVDLTLDKELYEDVKKVASKLRLPPRMFLRALIATVMEEARREAEARRDVAEVSDDEDED